MYNVYAYYDLHSVRPVVPNLCVMSHDANLGNNWVFLLGHEIIIKNIYIYIYIL